MQTLKKLLAMFLCASSVSWAQGNSFDKVRYNGGSVDSKVNPEDWNNHLTVTSNATTLALKDGKKLEIPPKSLTSLMQFRSRGGIRTCCESMPQQRNKTRGAPTAPASKPGMVTSRCNC